MQAKFDGDLLAAEVKALKQGVEIAKIVGCVLLIIEFNCQEAVVLVIRRKCSKPKIFWTISDVQEGLRRLKNTILQHISRLCDTAHSLAKMTLNIAEPAMWIDNCPSHLLYLFSKLNH